jgi:hypothetical protein
MIDIDPGRMNGNPDRGLRFMLTGTSSITVADSRNAL